MTLPNPYGDLLNLKPIELLVTPDNAQLIAYLTGKDVSQIAQRLLSAAETGVVCTVLVKKTADEIRYLKGRYTQAKNDIEKARRLIDGRPKPGYVITKEHDANQSNT